MNAPQTPRRLRKGHVGAGHLRTIVALMLREMGSRYGNSPGGYIWALIEPLGMIVILAFGFSLVLRSPSLGTSFILFYATGFLAYNLFLQLSHLVGNALLYSRPLLTYPAVTWFDAISARIVLNTLTGLLVSYILLTAIVLVVETPVVLNFERILMAYLLAVALGAGIGMVNCVLIGFFPIWQTIWAIITRPLFLASGVIFIYEDLPQMARELLWYNPLLHITGLMRSGFYAMYEPQYVSVPFVGAVSLVLIAFGLMLVRRFHREVLERR